MKHVLFVGSSAEKPVTKTSETNSQASQLHAKEIPMLKLGHMCDGNERLSGVDCHGW